MPRSLIPAHVDLWPDRALVVSALGSVAAHRHAAAALLVGLDGRFVVRWGGRQVETNAAYIPAGLFHSLECGETLMATLYLFAFSGDAAAFTVRHGLAPGSLSVDLALSQGLRDTLRGLHGGERLSERQTRAWLDRALIGGALGGRARADRRVRQAAVLLREEAAAPLEEVASAVGLSTSRLMHLFRAEVGVSAHQYRIWERMRRLTQHVAEGESLTMAGLAAGFSDSAHVSHGFRRMFGIPPSRVLHAVSRVRVTSSEL